MLPGLSYLLTYLFEEDNCFDTKLVLLKADCV